MLKLEADCLARERPGGQGGRLGQEGKPANYAQQRWSADDRKFMAMALDLARQAGDRAEVPVGAILVREGQVLASAGNHREALHSVLGHAEILAIHRAGRDLGGWRLTGATLYVTLEPCLMCAGALQQARVDRVVFGALDPKGGAARSLYQVLEDPRLNHRCVVEGGLMAEECGSVLTEFFRARRAKGRAPGSSAQ